jgi:hypothetical protein
MSDADYDIITTHPAYYDSIFSGLNRNITYYYKKDNDIDNEGYVELGRFKNNTYKGYIRESKFIRSNGDGTTDEPTIYSVKNDVFLNYNEDNNNRPTDKIYIYKKITKGGKRRKSRKSKRTRKSMKTMKNRK